MIRRSRIHEFGWVYRCSLGHYVYASMRRSQVLDARSEHLEACSG